MMENLEFILNLELKYVSGICIGIGTIGNYSQITANTILPDTDEEYEKEKEEIEANMQLYASSYNMLEMLTKCLSTISRLQNSMMAHPDHTYGSEFDDYTSLAQETIDEIQSLIQKAKK